MKVGANWLEVDGACCGYEICTTCKTGLYSVGPQGRLGGEHFHIGDRVFCATFGTIGDEVAETASATVKALL